MKSIAITGPSGVGKTHILKTLFGITGGYGALGVCGGKRPIATRNNLQFIPELKRIAKFREADNTKIEQGYRKLLTNGFVSCIDVGPYVSYCIPYARELTDCIVISIDCTEEQILTNLKSRKVQDNGKNNKVATAATSFKSLNRFHSNADLVLTQTQLLQYLQTQET